jgi:orotidine-5'-phosphate decarboxylase
MRSAIPPIIVALDHATEEEALNFLPELDPALCHVKIGSILFTHYGPSLLHKIMQRGFRIFLDLKFHDIPQTVAGACRAAADLGVWMVNVHVAGGPSMLAAAHEALQSYPVHQRPLLIGVTVLTSLNDDDLNIIGYQDNAAGMVIRFAKLACEAGLDGIVCSAQEARLLREHLPPDFLLVVPGIRLATDEQGDQKRVMSPRDALAAGADYLVIGRPITQSADPRQVLSQILTSIRKTR